MTVLNQQQQAELKGYVNRGDYHGGWTYLAKQGDRVEISSVVYSISRRILKHEHAQKPPSPPAPPPSHLAGLHAGEGKRHLPGTPLPSQPRHHLPRT